MDGDRPVADRRDIFESRIQELIDDAWWNGFRWGRGCDFEYPEDFSKQLHELVVSYFDSSASDVGSQDETSEEGAMGDGVRSESRLRGKSAQMYICDEVSEIRNKIEKEFAKELSEDFRKYHALHPNAKLVPTFEKEEKPDGSVMYKIIYKPALTYDV